MEPTDKRFKQFECGWALFESASDDETTDGYAPTYEVGGVVEEWVEEGGVGHFEPSEDYGGSLKGLFGRNWTLLGVPGVSKRSLKGPEHMI